MNNNILKIPVHRRYVQCHHHKPGRCKTTHYYLFNLVSHTDGLLGFSFSNFRYVGL